MRGALDVVYALLRPAGPGGARVWRRWPEWCRWPGARRRADAVLAAALDAALTQGWPVLPGTRCLGGPLGPCSCGDQNCAVPGAHPYDPPLLAATVDPRMVRWWWERRHPGAPVLLATGGAVCAVSLPAPAGGRVVEYFAELGTPVGPVVRAAGRYVLLVAPFTLEELGELLARHSWVPGCLRYHGPAGYLPLPPSRTGGGTARWVRPPAPGGGGELPDIATLLEGLIAASTAPDDSRLPF